MRVGVCVCVCGSEGWADAAAMTLATAMVNPLASIALKPEGDIKCVWV